MEYEFLNLDGCTPEEARQLSEILNISLSISDPHPAAAAAAAAAAAPSRCHAPEEEEPVVPSAPPPHPVPICVPSYGANPYPNVYINNVTANVNLHHSVPASEANPEPLPPPVQCTAAASAPASSPPLITAYPLHHLLLPGYNVSLSLPPPPPPPHHHSALLPLHRGLAVLRNPFYIQQQQQQQQQQPPQQPQHPPSRFPPFSPPTNMYPPPPTQQMLMQQQHMQLQQHPPPLPSQQETTIIQEQQQAAIKPGVIEFGGPPIYQETKALPEDAEEQQPAVIEPSSSPSPPPPKPLDEPNEPKAKEESVAPPPPPPPEPVREEEPLEVKETKVNEPPQKSWASLFRSSTTESPPFAESTQEKNTGNKPTARISPNDASVEERHESVPAPAPDVEYLSTKEGQLAEFLKKYVLNHKSFFVKPRGLSNRSNWCFVNAILQALVGCPPFFNLIRALPPLLLENGSILKSLSEFMSEFSPMDKFPKQHHRRNKKPEDLMTGTTFEATSIFRVLLSLPSTDTFKVIEGRQEDAEEFLTFLLNRVNDEMLAVLKKLEDSPSGESDIKDDREEKNNNEADDDWKEVGPKNKGCVTRRQVLGNTPLASMVQGQIRSCVTHSSSEPTATLQPFFTLQLDLQSENIRSVSDALINSFSMESLDGYVCSKTKLEIEASRSLSIDELPPVLILHLKRFIYNETSGGCQKLLKRIDFPVDLEIAKEILSPSSKTKYHAKQRQYKLFAVVYHNGGEATKGHYVTDVYHTGLSTWLRCDDCTIKSVNESSVLAHTHNSMPYILFYRRGDTMVGADKSNKN